MKRKINVIDKSTVQSVPVYFDRMSKQAMKHLFDLLDVYCKQELKIEKDYELMNDSLMIQLDLQRIYMKRYNEYIGS